MLIHDDNKETIGHSINEDATSFVDRLNSNTNIKL